MSSPGSSAEIQLNKKAECSRSGSKDNVVDKNNSHQKSNNVVRNHQLRTDRPKEDPSTKYKRSFTEAKKCSSDMKKAKNTTGSK